MNHSAIPKFHETFIPILHVLAQHDSMDVKSLKNEVIDAFYHELPSSLLKQTTKTGDLLIHNRISWGKCYLKEALFLEQPSRGIVQITSKGRSALAKGSLSLSDLKQDPDYLQTQDSKIQKENTPNTERHLLNEETPQDWIDRGIQELEQGVKIDLLEKLTSLDPYLFEKVILKLMKKMGYGEYTETPKSRDGGIDGIINQDHLGLNKIYIQAKRYSTNKVREPDIRDFIGAMSGDTLNGIFVTTSSFDQAAVEKAKTARHSIILIDGNQLCDLMYQFNIGVQTKTKIEIKQVDHDFFDEN